MKTFDKWKEEFQHYIENLEYYVELKPSYSKKTYGEQVHTFLQNRKHQFYKKKSRKKKKNKPTFNKEEKKLIHNTVELIFKNFNSSFETEIEIFKNEIQQKKTNLKAAKKSNKIENDPTKIPLNALIFLHKQFEQNLNLLINEEFNNF